MNNYDVKRFALIAAVNARIEGMKAENNQHPEDQPYTEKDFEEKANELENWAYCHNEQL